jgi:5-formyltetrahydrofolate cyclo-ligase
MQEEEPGSNLTAMPRPASAAKACLRQTLLARRDGLSATARAAAALELGQDTVWRELVPLLPAAGAVIAAYRAIRSELDPTVLVERLREEGFAIALPRVAPDGLAFHVHPKGATLVSGRFGLAEPPADAPLAQPALFLVPLLAFDASLNRLGYGKAYYDRAFARWPSAQRIGIAFRCQQVPMVPMEAHDLPLHHVLIAGP